ncbi:MAG: hypothetical protein CYPHOPRED_005429 [Cyphobasidiales sp. Tagirdzhanova-0007]|nr:MAG: hypothetical protein CYPHOPRED_005429 [Cyphobasidiales sp. Tagirdzhanova-0007]
MLPRIFRSRGGTAFSRLTSSGGIDINVTACPKQSAAAAAAPRNAYQSAHASDEKATAPSSRAGSSASSQRGHSATPRNTNYNVRSRPAPSFAQNRNPSKYPEAAAKAAYLKSPAQSTVTTTRYRTDARGGNNASTRPPDVYNRGLHSNNARGFNGNSVPVDRYGAKRRPTEGYPSDGLQYPQSAKAAASQRGPPQTPRRR